ncbi:lytic transglycosylase domain-containing protein [Streptomyces sp. WMMC1477]|uniref:lytic transglycosylase domain-containing protein n=1 Tax=Streptomyces sp. WMMC1477 TaxID=3015155 RepID=UPI002FC39D70
MSATAVAAAAMVALTASQAPGIPLPLAGPSAEDPARGADDTPPADGNGPYHTELPPLESPGPSGRPGHSDDADEPVVTGPAEAGIPATVLSAYQQAESTLRSEQPGCNLPWQLLAAIGKVESGHARGGAVDARGTTVEPIRGPRLDGNGFARITDTDGGAFDGDTTYDRAVGPMQFIPSTWATWGADANGDGARNPENVFDAALAAGRYLCAGGRDLSNAADLERAILSYNRSRDYLHTVLSWLEFYRKGVHEVPDGSGELPDSPGAGNPDRPAVRPADDEQPKEKREPEPDAEPGKDEESDAPKPPGKGDRDPDGDVPPDEDPGDGTGEVPDDGADGPDSGPNTPPGEEPDGDTPGDEEPDEEPEDPDSPDEEPEDPEQPGDPEEEPDEPGECPVDPAEPGDPEDPDTEEPGEGTEEPSEDPEVEQPDAGDPEATDPDGDDPEDPDGDGGDPEAPDAEEPDGDGDDPEDPEDPDAEDPDADDPEDGCEGADGDTPEEDEQPRHGEQTADEGGATGGTGDSGADADDAARPEDAARTE